MKSMDQAFYLTFPISFFFFLICFISSTGEVHICGLLQISVAHQRTWLTYKAGVYSSGVYLS